MSKRVVFLKLLLVVANLCKLQYCTNKFVCTVLTDLYKLDSAENRYTCTFYEDACYEDTVIDLKKDTIGNCKI